MPHADAIRRGGSAWHPPEYNRVMFDYPDILLFVALMATMATISLVASVKFLWRRQLPVYFRVVMIALLVGAFVMMIVLLALPPIARK